MTTPRFSDITMELPVLEDPTSTIKIPVHVFLAVRRVILATDRQTALNVASIGAMAVAMEATREQIERTDQLIASIAHIATILGKDKKLEQDEDWVLYALYRMLKAKQITRKQAAVDAGYLLGKTYTPDAFRKKMERYVKGKGWDPIDLPKGRPQKQDKG